MPYPNDPTAVPDDQRVVLGTELQGTAADITRVAEWLRTCARQVDDCADRIVQARDRLADSWLDLASLLALPRLASGARNSRHLADQIRGLADVVESCAGPLSSAQDLMEQATTVATEGFLQPAKGGFYRPLLRDNLAVGVPDYGTAQDLLGDRNATYAKAEALVQRAVRQVVDRLIELGALNEQSWSHLYFFAGDLAVGEATELFDRYEQRHGAGAGRLMRVLKVGGGPLVAAAGVIYDIHAGEDYMVAIVTGAVGLGAGSATLALGLLVYPGAGWLLAAGIVLFGAIVGMLGAEVAKDAFERYEPRSPRQKLEELGQPPPPRRTPNRYWWEDESGILSEWPR